MASEIRVNTFKNRSGLGTITVNDDGANFSGIVTATSFSGDGAQLTNAGIDALESMLFT
jgi:hypothetical protein